MARCQTSQITSCQSVPNTDIKLSTFSKNYLAHKLVTQLLFLNHLQVKVKFTKEKSAGRRCRRLFFVFLNWNINAHKIYTLKGETEKKASGHQVKVKSFLFQATFSSQAPVILDQGVKLPQDFFSILQKMLQDQAR